MEAVWWRRPCRTISAAKSVSLSSAMIWIALLLCATHLTVCCHQQPARLFGYFSFLLVQSRRGGWLHGSSRQQPKQRVGLDVVYDLALPPITSLFMIYKYVWSFSLSLLFLRLSFSPFSTRKRLEKKRKSLMRKGEEKQAEKPNWHANEARAPFDPFCSCGDFSPLFKFLGKKSVRKLGNVGGSNR